MTDRKDWIAENKNNNVELDNCDKETTNKADAVRKTTGGDTGAQRVIDTRVSKRPAAVSKDGFVTNSNPIDVEDRLKV